MKRSYDTMRDEMIRSLGFGAHMGDQHRFAIEWLFAKQDAFEADVLERLTKLERKTSSTELVTLHEELRDLGNGIHEGRSYRVRWHDPYPKKQTEPPLRLGKHGDPHLAHHPACNKPDQHQGHCIDPKGYEPTEEVDES